MKGSNLLVDVVQRFGVTLVEALAPVLKPRYVAYPAYGLHDESIAIASREDVERYEAEDDDDAEDCGNGGVDGQVAYGSESEVDEDA